MGRYLLRPTDDVKAEWTEDPAGTAWSVLDDSVEQPTAPTTGSDRITVTTNSKTSAQGLQTFTLGGSEEVEYARLWVYCKAASGFPISIVLYDSTVPGNLASTLVSSTSFGWVSCTYTGSLTQAKINGLEARVISNAAGSGTLEVDAVYVEVITHSLTGTSKDLYDEIQALDPDLLWVAEPSGTVVPDHSGNFHHGDHVGNVTASSTPLLSGGQAKLTTANNIVSGIRARDYQPYVPGAALSLIVIQKRTGNPGFATTFAGDGTGGASPNAPHPTWEIGGGTGPDGYVRFYATVNTFPVGWVDTVLGIGDVTQLLDFEFDDTTSLSTYSVNGEEKGAWGPSGYGPGDTEPGPYTGAAQHFNSSSLAGKFTFGFRGTGTTYETFIGDVEMVAVIPRLLTTSERSALASAAGLSPFPTTPVLDALNRVENPLSLQWVSSALDGDSPLASAWSVGYGTTSGRSSALRQDLDITDCEAYVTMWTPPGFGGEVFVLARMNNGDGYAARVIGTETVELWTVVDGEFDTRLSGGSIAPDWSAGDGLGISCVGTTIKAWIRRNGMTSWGESLTVTDATYTHGTIGVGGVGSAFRLDDFGGGGSDYTPPAETNTVKVRVSGTFVDKDVLYQVGGNFIDATKVAVLPIVAAPTINTTITSGPNGVTTNDNTPTFTFTSSVGGATFESSIDGGAWSSATSPKTLSTLGEGSHTFRVRSSHGGNTDPTPASATFTVDTVYPDTTITGGPSQGQTIGTNSTAFAFSSNDGSATFETKLDGGSYSVATSPKYLTSLADGSHTFYVRAKDGSGNYDPTPATRTFTVQTTTPPIDKPIVGVGINGSGSAVSAMLNVSPSPFSLVPFKHARMEFGFGTTPQTILDVCNAYLARGITPLVNITFPQPTPPSPTDAGNYFSSLVPVLQGKVDALEYGNESYGNWYGTPMSPTAYGQSVLAAAQASNGRIKVLAQASNENRAGYGPWTATMLATVPLVKNWVGGWTVHYYQPTFESSINSIQSQINGSAYPHIWITEMGYASTNNGRTLSPDNYGNDPSMDWAEAGAALDNYWAKVKTKVYAMYIFQLVDNDPSNNTNNYRENYFGTTVWAGFQFWGGGGAVNKGGYSDAARRIISEGR